MVDRPAEVRTMLQQASSYMTLTSSRTPYFSRALARTWPCSDKKAVLPDICLLNAMRKAEWMAVTSLLLLYCHHYPFLPSSVPTRALR